MNIWVPKGESNLRQIVLMPLYPWATNPTEHRGGGGYSSWNQAQNTIWDPNSSGAACSNVG